MSLAIVTGGSRGIGAAIVKKLAAEGYDVVINCVSNVAKAEAVAEDAEEEKVKRIYLGPSIPRYGLRHGQILSGDRSAVEGYISGMEERFPTIRHLMVTPDRLAEAQEKTGDKTSVLHRYYMEIAARAGKRGE